MRQYIASVYCLIAALAFLLGMGCSQTPTAPAPLAAESIPAELDKAFGSAQQATKDLVAKVNSGLQSKDYSSSYDAVQALCGAPGATKEQRALSALAMLTIYGLLQTAQAQGDQNAAAALRYHQMTK